MELTKPLFASVEKNKDEIVVNCTDIDMYGVGETEQEAIIDFSEDLSERYDKAGFQAK